MLSNVSDGVFLRELPSAYSCHRGQFGVEIPAMLPPANADLQLAIVDTNNPAELPDDLANWSLHSVVDHHKLAGM